MASLNQKDLIKSISSGLKLRILFIISSSLFSKNIVSIFSFFPSMISEIIFSTSSWLFVEGWGIGIFTRDCIFRLNRQKCCSKVVQSLILSTFAAIWKDE